MAFRLRLVKDKTSIDFMRWRKPMLVLSAIAVLLTFFLLFTRGPNYGIDFTGGVLMEVKAPAGMKVEDVRTALSNLSAGRPMIQGTNDGSFLIRVPGRELSGDTQKALYAEVKETLGPETDFRRVEYVGPQVGKELIMKGVWAFVYSMFGIMLYIWLRYEWRFGLAGIISLAHDVIFTLLFFLVTQIEFDLSTVAAILLVAGYSVNDTVIVFDRIREIMAKYRKLPMSDIVNLAVNETLSRTLITSTTTLVVLIVLAAFGNTVIQGFVYAMIVGVVVGTFSSIYLAAALLPYMGVRRTPAQEGEGAQEQAASTS